MLHEPIETMEKNGFRVAIHSDLAPENPREWDNLGKMVCFHRRYLLGDVHGYYSPKELEEDLETGRYYHLPLYLYDHSRLRMSTSPFSCPWDSGQVGYIMVEKEKAREKAPEGGDAEEWALQILENEVRVYDQYLVGDAYGWILSDPDGVEVDSCWGYFGIDCVRSAAEKALNDHVEEFGKVAREKVRSATEWLLHAGLIGSEKVGQAMDFLTSVEESGEIEHFRSKLKDTGFLREAAASHLMNLFGFGREDAGAVLDLFVWKGGLEDVR